MKEISTIEHNILDVECIEEILVADTRSDKGTRETREANMSVGDIFGPRKPTLKLIINDYLTRTRGKVRLAFLNDFRDLDLVHWNLDQHTFVFNAEAKDGTYQAIKLWAPAPWLSESENKRKQQKFLAEMDMLYVMRELMHREDVMAIRKQGMKKYAGDSFLHYFTTDYLQRSLNDIDPSTFPLKKLVNITKKVGLTLAFLHEHEYMLHRDVNPNNIMLTADDEPVLIDFGVMQGMHIEGRRAEVGTIPYISPGQAEGMFNLMIGKPVPVLDYSADLYSLGTTLANIIFKNHPGNRLEALREFYNTEENLVHFYSYIAFGKDILFPSTGNKALDEFIYRSRTNTDDKYKYREEETMRDKSMREAVNALEAIEKDL